MEFFHQEFNLEFRSFHSKKTCHHPLLQQTANRHFPHFFIHVEEKILCWNYQELLRRYEVFNSQVRIL